MASRSFGEEIVGSRDGNYGILITESSDERWPEWGENVDIHGTNHDVNQDLFDTRISPPETLPKPSCLIPFPRNPGFVDRRLLLDQIHKKCSAPASWTALVGPGRVGKSQLAIEHSYRVEEESPETWIFWVHAGNGARIAQSYWDIAEQVKPAGLKNLQANVLRLVYELLRDEKHGAWLIVVDNLVVAGQQTLSRYLPMSRHGSVLITSQTRQVALELVEETDIIQIESIYEVPGSPQASLLLPALSYVGDRHSWRLEMEIIKNKFKLEWPPQWHMDAEVGRGGFGTVFAVRSPMVSGQMWAIKRIIKREPRLELEKDPIIREIVASAILTQQRSQLFVNFFGWNEDNLNFYLAMEYIEMGDLEKHLDSPWAENEVRMAIQQLLSGLALMHTHHITHRDLKPKNIFLVSRDPVHVKIGDFGISKRIPEGSSSVLNTRFSTQGYSAPEIIMEDQYTSAVDLWSLGCVLYRMISGTRLFRRDMDAVLWDGSWYGRAGRERLDAIIPESVNNSGLDMMMNLLIKEPQDRLTAVAALEHPWFNLY